MKRSLKIIVLLLISTTALAQELRYGIHAGSSVSWMESNDIRFQEQIKAGDFFIQADVDVFYYRNYYLSTGLEFVRLDASLNLDADTFIINNQLFRQVNDVRVRYTGNLLNVPIAFGFESKRDPRSKLYPFAGAGLVNHFAFHAQNRYTEEKTEMEYTKQSNIYGLSYRFNIGVKWQYNKNMLLYMRIHYQKGISSLAQEPDQLLNMISLAIGLEFKPQ